MVWSNHTRQDLCVNLQRRTFSRTTGLPYPSPLGFWCLRGVDTRYFQISIETCDIHTSSRRPSKSPSHLLWAPTFSLNKDISNSPAVSPRLCYSCSGYLDVRRRGNDRDYCQHSQHRWLPTHAHHLNERLHSHYSPHQSTPQCPPHCQHHRSFRRPRPSFHLRLSRSNWSLGLYSRHLENSNSNYCCRRVCNYQHCFSSIWQHYGVYG